MLLCKVRFPSYRVGCASSARSLLSRSPQTEGGRARSRTSKAGTGGASAGHSLEGEGTLDELRDRQNETDFN